MTGGEDIIPLANYFIELYNRKFGRAVHGIAADAVAALHAHEWPGNVRELRNAIERAMLMEADTLLGVAGLGIKRGRSFDIATQDQDIGSGDISLAQTERTMVVWALEKTSWNQTQASQLLKISRDALRYKMKKFNQAAARGVGSRVSVGAKGK